MVLFSFICQRQRRAQNRSDGQMSCSTLMGPHLLYLKAGLNDDGPRVRGKAGRQLQPSTGPENDSTLLRDQGPNVRSYCQSG